MLYAKDYRAIARKALNGKWIVAVVAGFIASLLGGTISSGSAANTNYEFEAEQLQNGIPPEISTVLLGLLGGVAMVAIVLLIINIIIGGAVQLGYASFNLNLMYGRKADIGDVFSQFHRFKEGFVMLFLRGIYTFLWMLLFIVPGIMKGYSYAMTPYILFENPGMTANEAITASKEMMQGHRWQLFCLHFSFIGWSILTAITFGIGNLFLRPYVEAAHAAFYCQLKSQKYQAAQQV